MEKKQKINYIIKAAISLLCFGVLLLLWFKVFSPQIDNLKLIYQTNNNIWFKTEADRMTMQFFAQMTIIVAITYIVYLISDILCLYKTKDIKKRSIIILVAVTILSIGLICILYTTFNSKFMLSSFYYFFIACIIIISGLYAFSRSKSSLKEKNAVCNEKNVNKC